jgi:hypothetical protein
VTPSRAASTATLGEALAEFRGANGIERDAASASSWTCRLGPIGFRLPNFKWRREAILRHDLHHVLTGYPGTMGGEFQMAAWEFAAGRFPHAAATLLCLPLVAIGFMWSPRRIWSAFRSGRHVRSLYDRELSEAILTLSPSAVCLGIARVEARRTLCVDAVAFCVLLSRAFLLVGLPAAAAVLVAFAWC